MVRKSVKDNKPTVSVIIPCYNLGRYLDEAVESVLAQRYKGWELIIVDDGSTDRLTRRKLAAWQTKGITVIRTKNNGLPTARNIGIKRARGEYVCCLDADDKLHPRFLARTVAVLKADRRQNLGFVSTDVERFGEWDEGYRTDDYDIGKALLSNPVHVASLFRKKCWQQVGGYDKRLSGYQDWDFWLSIAAKGYRWQVVHQRLFCYRIRKGSMLSGSDGKRGQLYSQILKKHEKLLRENCLAVLLAADRRCRAFDGDLEVLARDSKMYYLISSLRAARSSLAGVLLLPLRLVKLIGMLFRNSSGDGRCR